MYEVVKAQVNDPLIFKGVINHFYCSKLLDYTLHQHTMSLHNGVTAHYDKLCHHIYNAHAELLKYTYIFMIMQYMYSK